MFFLHINYAYQYNLKRNQNNIKKSVFKVLGSEISKENNFIGQESTFVAVENFGNPKKLCYSQWPTVTMCHGVTCPSCTRRDFNGYLGKLANFLWLPMKLFTLIFLTKSFVPKWKPESPRTCYYYRTCTINNTNSGVIQLKVGIRIRARFN